MHKIVIGSLLLIGSLSVQAHGLWLNHIESVEGGHHMVFIGFGHAFPLEDTMVDDWGAVHMEHYDLITPKGKKISLGIPEITPLSIKEQPGGISVQEGADIGLKKLRLGDKAEQGIYQIAGGTPMTYFTSYKNKKGRVTFAEVPPDQIEDLAEVVKTSAYAMYVKTLFYNGESSFKQPDNVGHPLEIVPLSNLKGIKAGDRVSFKVLINGRPMKDYGAYFLARNMAFGIDQMIHVKLINGEGELRLPTGGQWRIEAAKEAPPEEFRGMDEYEGKVMMVSLSASFTFHAEP